MRAPHATANCLSEIPQLFSPFFAPHYARCVLRAVHPPHTLASCLQQLRRHVQFMYSRASRSFPASRLRQIAAPPRLRATRTPTPITFADCPNECLYQCWSRSVQQFERQCWICSAERAFARAVHACMRTRDRQ
jgi:hypothetical protein